MRAVRWIALASALLLSQLSLPLPESWSLSVAAADSQLPTAEHAGVGYQLEDAGAASFDERLTRLESLLTQPRYVTPLPQTVAPRTVAPQSTASLYAGMQFLFVKPQMKESFEATLITPGVGQNTLVPLDYDFHVTPRAWLGFSTAEAVGLRVTYWGFDHNGNGRTLVSDGVTLPGATATTVIYPAAIIAPAPGDILQTHSSLNVQTVDLEGTADVQVQSLDVLLSGGLRYASTDQQMSAVASRGGLPIGLLNWSRQFEGFGPTVAATATRPILGGLSAFGSLRGSLLYGDKDLNRTVIGDITPAPVAGPPFVGLNGADEVVACGDLGIGLRYAVELQNSSEVFVQGTYEGQLWTEAGAPTLTFLGFNGLGLSVGYMY